LHSVHFQPVLLAGDAKHRTDELSAGPVQGVERQKMMKDLESKLPRGV